jgi:hypothetical protein
MCLCGLDLCGSEYGLDAIFCEHGNEISGSRKYGKFFDQTGRLSAFQVGFCFMKLASCCTCQ